MKLAPLSLVPVILIACTQAAQSPPPAQVPAPSQATARNDSLRADRMMHVNRIREQIKGKEDLPAEEVFQNIKLMKTMPARRLLSIMNGGYSSSLGVSCSHCHVTSDFAKEDKPEKQVARDMSLMLRTINDTLLRRIPNLKSATPGLNCGTCHNGRARPGFGPQQQTRGGTG